MLKRNKDILTLNNIIVLILIIIINLKEIKSQKCEQTSITYLYRTHIICKDIVDKFPEIKSQTYSLTCLNCSVPTFINETIMNFRGDIFNVSYSNVKSIDRGAFDTFWKTVKKFKFNNNNINYVEKDIFKSFTGLQELNFNHNNITSLLTNQFDGVNSDIIDLSYNQLTDIKDIFNGVGVSYLNLSFNRIKDLPVGILNGVTFKVFYGHYVISERHLNLASNDIEKIQNGSFMVKGDLGTLTLRNNRIKLIDDDAFNNLKIRILDLSNNEISRLNKRSFYGLTNLRTLVLSNNFIDSIPLGSLSFSLYLESLKLDGNMLTTLQPLTFSGAPALRILNISHNYMESLRESVLVPLGNIVEIDLSYNRISTFNLKGILENNHKLKKLHMNHNFWLCKELINNYKLLNNRSGSFENSGTNFHVPNLHGIACSRTAFAVTSDLTFDEFIESIGKDVNLEDLYDVEIETSKEDINNLISSYMSSIYYLLLFLTIIITIFYLNIFIKCFCLFLQKKNIISKNFTILYNNENDIRLV